MMYVFVTLKRSTSQFLVSFESKNFVDINVCLNKCFTSQSTAIVMTGRCLHLMGLLPNIRCHDTQNVFHKYNHPTRPKRLICMCGLTKSLFLGRLRHER